MQIELKTLFQQRLGNQAAVIAISEITEIVGDNWLCSAERVAQTLNASIAPHPMDNTKALLTRE